MAIITLDAPSYSDVKSTTATIQTTITLRNELERPGSIRETLKSVSLYFTSDGTSASFNSSTYILSVNGLTAGTSNQICCQLTCSREQYQESTTTIYWFLYDIPEYQGEPRYRIQNENLTWVKKQYENYKKLAYELYPSIEHLGSAEKVVWQDANNDICCVYVTRISSSAWVTIDDSTTISNLISVYTKPSELPFYFNGDKAPYGSGTKWKVSDGIISILPNIKNFNSVATKWKRWQNQSNEMTCSAFGSSGKLSAAMLNSAYAYLGINKKYQPGDKVAAAMFKGLENKLNE